MSLEKSLYVLVLLSRKTKLLAASKHNHSLPVAHDRVAKTKSMTRPPCPELHDHIPEWEIPLDRNEALGKKCCDFGACLLTFPCVVYNFVLKCGCCITLASIGASGSIPLEGTYVSGCILVHRPFFAVCEMRDIRNIKAYKHYVFLMMSCILAHDVYVLLLIASNTAQMVSLQVNN